MSQDNRARLKQWLESGEIRLEPLTFPQRELWEASPVSVADASNNICATIQLRGLLTRQGSEAALQKVVDRQEVLRLSFLPGKGQPMQMIRNAGKPMLEFHELSVPQQQPGAIEELAKEVFSKPFDLVQGPLYRVEVFRRAADDHVLMFAIHHAVADGWTLGVFFQDLVAAYMDGLRGMHAGNPPVPLSYTEWGATERAFWRPAELEQRGTFWKSSLAGAPRLWSPPTGPKSTSGERERWVSLVPADVGRAVRELARRNGATLFSTLLAAFQIALSKWTGADDILVGTPVANRSKHAVRETMGYFSGIVPLRGQVDRTQAFSNSLRAVHKSTVDSFANAMPFAELVRELGDSPSPGHNPIFEVRFALQNHLIPDVAVPGLSLQFRMCSTGTARFDLGCEINEKGDGLEVAWLFLRHLFPLDDILNLGHIYQAVLARVCRSPESRADALMTNL
ncbi:MAG TPA: condensation domain-containing protein [Chthoniobacterales bacterium]|jgi:hypothetical protein|nr:condensation domain-containing protein [Chthoniobacterales bacterium]